LGDAFFDGSLLFAVPDDAPVRERNFQAQKETGNGPCGTPDGVHFDLGV
jgi:hypothetical protein